MRKKWFLLWGLLALAALLLLIHTARQNRNAMTTSSYAAQSCVVILDAGHGGFDGGTTAADGTVEKDINLSVVKKLDALLHAAGVQTRLTRTDDQSIHDPQITSVRQQKISDIHNRLQIMEQTENAIFVSIHQNHFSASKYRGTQVFYSGNNAQSKALASAIQSSVIAILQPENHRTIKQSGTEIFLLYHAVRPAVMVECGFLSNPDETQLLKTDQYQKQLALSIYQGIVKFMEDSEVV